MPTSKAKTHKTSRKKSAASKKRTAEKAAVKKKAAVRKTAQKKTSKKAAAKKKATAGKKAAKTRTARKKTARKATAKKLTAKKSTAKKATKKTATRKKATRRSASSNDGIRERLLEQRQEMIDLYKADLKVGQSVESDGATDIVDQANDAYNREIMFSLSNGERKQLLEIEGALERLDDGKYGTCIHCSLEIPSLRLQAVPWARYCIHCQEAVEDGLIDDA